MKDGSWLEMFLVVVLALIAYDCWSRRGRRAGADVGASGGSRFVNQPTPKTDIAVSPGLSPGGAGGTVPQVDGARKECGCS